MRLVVIESPFGSPDPEELKANILYARRCLRDSLLRNEAPVASHLLYTQPGVLNDVVPADRKCGIEAGLAWLRVAEASVVYTDRGISVGMAYGIRKAKEFGIVVEYRSLETPKLGES